MIHLFLIVMQLISGFSLFFLTFSNMISLHMLTYSSSQGELFILFVVFGASWLCLFACFHLFSPNMSSVLIFSDSPSRIPVRQWSDFFFGGGIMSLSY